MRSKVVDALLPIGALIGALLLFGLFVWLGGTSPTETWRLLFQGAFGDWFSWQNTLQRAAPLMLTALCVALPARAGLIVIGGEGALVLGGLASAALAHALPLPGNIAGTAAVCIAGALAGALWIALAGWLRQYRGINETISSLLLAYIAIGIFKHLVEGPLRDPASLNKPSTHALNEGLLIGGIGGSDVHWGFVIGVGAFPTEGVGASYERALNGDDHKVSIAQIEMAPSASFRIIDGLAVGRGYRITYTRQTVYQRPTAGQPPVDQTLQGINWFGLHLGVYYRPIERLHFGFTYRSRIDTAHSFCMGRAPAPLSPPTMTQWIRSWRTGPRSSSRGSTDRKRTRAGALLRCLMRGRPYFRSSTLTPHQMCPARAAKASFVLSRSRRRSDPFVSTW